MARDHGTRVRYVCGPDVRGQSGRGCRCTPCTQANRRAEDHRARMKLYGQWRPYVDASPAREHLRALAAAGIGWRRAAQLAGVASGAVSKLLYGGPGDRPPSRGIRAETERKLLAVRATPESLSAGARTDAAGTRHRVQALVAAGYSQAILAERLGIQRSNFRLATCNQVTAGTARAVRELYDALWDIAPDESTHRARISVSRARNYARARDWALPLAWDDDAIDDPAAKPAEGWRRSERTTLRSADLVEDAEFVREAGDYRTPNQVAMRLGVSRDRLERVHTGWQPPGGDPERGRLRCPHLADRTRQTGLSCYSPRAGEALADAVTYRDLSGACQRRSVTPAFRALACQLQDAWWDKTPPPRTPAERRAPPWPCAKPPATTGPPQRA